ncbi:hypothetical protein ACI5KX_14155 [Erythrobacter sp. GH1-10]|uniref:hypothetical protein n=1 Tax=Erythrobacter sp. GH1-10 TaxID=3349334 RepID=UPI0038781ADA
MADLNLSLANTNSLRHFIRSHEAFGNLSKVASVGLAILKDEIGNGTPASVLWNRVASISEKWGTEPQFTEDIAHNAYAEIASLGIAKSFSSFDKYLVDVDAELLSAASLIDSRSDVRLPPLENIDDDLDSPRASVEMIYERQGFDTSAIAFSLPVFDYYQSVRNCIVHRDGLASKALCRKARSKDLEATLEAWVEITGEHGALKLKTFEQDEAISLDYFDNILCYSVLRRLAQDTDKQAVDRMGIDGLTYRAVRYLNAKWQSGQAEEQHTTATKSVASHLAQVNRVMGNDWRAIEPRLKRLGLLRDCRQAFDFRQNES